MNLDEKVGAARELVVDAFAHAQRPVVYWSSGKDSTVLLALVREVAPEVDVIFHRDPCFGDKYTFADRVIAEWKLKVHDYLPTKTGVAKNPANGEIEVVNFYRVPGEQFMWLPTGIKAPAPGQPFLCGLKDLVQRETAEFDYSWDMAFVGAKSSDVCPVLGSMPLATGAWQPSEAFTIIFPLRHFTDADVWEYITRERLPYNERRYDAANGFREFEDKTFNNDWQPTCTRCIDRDQPEMVECPLTGGKVPNVSATAGYVPLPDLAYVEKPA